MIPEYIYQYLIRRVGDISDNNLRDASNLSNLTTRTEVFRKSCLPTAIPLMNKLSPSTKQCELFTTILNQLKFHLFGHEKSQKIS